MIDLFVIIFIMCLILLIYDYLLVNNLYGYNI